jgi:hypothetical protein
MDVFGNDPAADLPNQKPGKRQSGLMFVERMIRDETKRRQHGR